MAALDVLFSGVEIEADGAEQADQEQERDVFVAGAQ